METALALIVFVLLLPNSLYAEVVEEEDDADALSTALSMYFSPKESKRALSNKSLSISKFLGIVTSSN